MNENRIRSPGNLTCHGRCAGRPLALGRDNAKPVQVQNFSAEVGVDARLLGSGVRTPARSLNPRASSGQVLELPAERLARAGFVSSPGEAPSTAHVPVLEQLTGFSGASIGFVS